MEKCLILVLGHRKSVMSLEHSQCQKERHCIKKRKKKDGAFQKDAGTNLKEFEIAKGTTNFSKERERTEVYLKEFFINSNFHSTING